MFKDRWKRIKEFVKDRNKYASLKEFEKLKKRFLLQNRDKIEKGIEEVYFEYLEMFKEFISGKVSEEDFKSVWNDMIRVFLTQSIARLYK